MAAGSLVSPLVVKHWASRSGRRGALGSTVLWLGSRIGLSRKTASFLECLRKHGRFRPPGGEDVLPISWGFLLVSYNILLDYACPQPGRPADFMAGTEVQSTHREKCYGSGAGWRIALDRPLLSRGSGGQAPSDLDAHAVQQESFPVSHLGNVCGCFSRNVCWPRVRGGRARHTGKV